MSKFECPECHTQLHHTARYCGCGWKRDNPFNAPTPIVDCSHMGCRSPAMCKIKTKTGWANLCHTHYDKHFADEAHASLDKYGMARLADESTAEHVLRMREFVRKGVRSIGRQP